VPAVRRRYASLGGRLPYQEELAGLVVEQRRAQLWEDERLDQRRQEAVQSGLRHRRDQERVDYGNCTEALCLYASDPAANRILLLQLRPHRGLLLLGQLGLDLHRRVARENN